VQRISDELRKYNAAAVSSDGLEIDDYESSVLLGVIRRREMDFVAQTLSRLEPKHILEIGCGPGWFMKKIGVMGKRIVGVDISYNLMRRGKANVSNLNFVQCDAHNLPFQDASFDIVVGFGILHHLDDKIVPHLGKKTRSGVLFIEPSRWNILHHLGRKLFPMETHTQGEKQYLPHNFRSLFTTAGFQIAGFTYSLHFSFLIARILKILNKKPPSWLITALYLVERAVERIPLLNRFGSVVVLFGLKK
jgi:SAM-dependent methyltransferase